MEPKKLLDPNIKATIEGRSIILKPISINEITSKYVSWLNDPEINKYLEVRHKRQTIEDIFDYINGLRAKPDHDVFAIFTKKDKIYIGSLAVVYDLGNRRVAYGLMIGDKNAQTLGLGGEAAILIIEYLFNDPDIRKVFAGAIADNKQSCRLHKSLGFKREAILRQHYTLSSGKVCDGYLFGILREEWLAIRSKYASILKHIKIKSDDYE